MNPNSSQPSKSSQSRSTRSRLALWLVIAVCVAPVIASYVVYYGVRPEARSNHGVLLEPQVDVAALPITVIEKPSKESGFLDVLERLPKDDPRGALEVTSDFRGRWLLVRVGPSACDEACLLQLRDMRQIRLATGRDRNRIERLWLVTDASPVSLPEEFEGTWVIRISKRELADWPTEAGEPLHEQLFIIDPLGKLIMRFPKGYEAKGLKNDLTRLLKASRVG